MRMAGASRSLPTNDSAATQSATEAPQSGQSGDSITSVAPTRSSPLRKPSAENTSLVATATLGLTSRQGSSGGFKGRRLSPIPVMSQAWERRQTGTSAPVSSATSLRRSSSSGGSLQCPQHRGGGVAPRRAAPDAGGDRQNLFQRECSELQVRHTCSQQHGRLQHEILGDLAAGLRQRTRDFEFEIGAGDGRQAG